MVDSPELELTIRFTSFDDLRAWMENTDGRSTAAAPTPAPAAAPAAPNAPAAAPVAAAPAPASPTANPGEVERDAQGMPYDPELHTTTKTLNADGTWKALRGKAEEAKAARAEFLARGGADAAASGAPDPAPAAAPAVAVMPGTEAAPAPAPAAGGMPGMPGVEAREVSMDELVQKTTELMTSGVLSKDALRGHYQEIGLTSPDQFASDPALRLRMINILESI